MIEYHSVLELFSALNILDVTFQHDPRSSTLIILETTEVGRFKSSGRSAILEVISASGSLYLHHNMNAQGLLSLLQMWRSRNRDLDTIRKRIQVRTRLYLWRLLSCARMPRTKSQADGWEHAINLLQLTLEGTSPILT